MALRNANGRVEDLEHPLSYSKFERRLPNKIRIRALTFDNGKARDQSA